MVVARFSDGQILTAGSLNMLPQFSDQSLTRSANYSSGTNAFDLGSLYISGGLFTRTLYVNWSVHGVGTVAGGSGNVSLVLSGAGLGGGSTILDYALWESNVGQSADFLTIIPSNAGWIPGSAVVIFGRAITNQNTNYGRFHMDVWGNG